ncbi:MAG: hypothetical protein ACOCUH_04195 [Bacteriovoracia bacterium]
MTVTEKLSSDIILRHLEEKDIFLSSSSACSARIKGNNSVFEALNIPRKSHKNVLRISLSPDTTKEEIDTFILNFNETVKKLSKLL